MSDVSFPDRIVRISYRGASPYHVLAGAETVALLTSDASEWYLYVSEWPWTTPLLGFLSPPLPGEEYARRITGGPVWRPVGGGEGYAVLIGPRSGSRPASLASIYELVVRLVGVEARGPLMIECGEGVLYACPGKLVQRPFIEFCGPLDCVYHMLSSNNVGVSGETVLDASLLRGDSLERLASVEWLDPVSLGDDLISKTYTSSQGYGLQLVALLGEEEPFIRFFRIYTDSYVYPPGQVRLLISQFEGAPPSRVAALELLNTWGSLVEHVGYPFGEFVEAVLDFFSLLEDRAYSGEEPG